MGVEIVEGTLDPGQPKRNKRGYALFPQLTITTPAGERRSFAKVATGEPVTSEVLAGGQGRYCFTRSGGALGLVGVRRPTGTSVFGYFTNMIPIMVVAVVVASVVVLVLHWMEADGERAAGDDARQLIDFLERLFE